MILPGWTKPERNAAYEAAQHQIKVLAVGLAGRKVSDDELRAIVDAALDAALNKRNSSSPDN